jgi:hypothetical protein
MVNSRLLKNLVDKIKLSIEINANIVNISLLDHLVKQKY